MQTGTKISGAAHIGLIGFAILGSAWSASPPPLELPAVSVVTAEEYAALVSPQAPVEAPVPEAKAEPETPAPEPAPEPEVVEKAPEPEPAPEVVEVPVKPEPVTPEPEPPAPEPVAQPTPEPPAPRPVERVAPEVVAPKPPDVKTAEEVVPEVAPEKGAETPQEPKEAAAPEEATDRITPEPKRESALAPTQSRRPPSNRPPPPPEKPVETAVAKPAAKPEPKPEPKQIDTTAALREALGGGEQAAAPAPAGPPMTEGEKEALRVSVSKCWSLGSSSTAAMETVVVVGVDVAKDGKPETGSIRLLSSSSRDDAATRVAFDAARRAIIRCGSKGFDLPAEKYDRWRQIEMTFDPSEMRRR